MASFGLDIVKAEAFSNSSGVILDSFTFADPHRSLELNATEVDRLRGVVRDVVEGRKDVHALLRGRPKPLLAGRARIAPRVFMSDDAADASTLVEITAQDRPGLLHDLGEAISSAGCNIEIVMIGTEAHKAMDVFYLSHQGEKLSPAVQEQLKAALLTACSGTR
ncbi:MAG: ACT domain-containing protein [Acidobacteriota bacterium]